MDKKLRLEKLKMWKDTLKELEGYLAVILAKKGEAAQEGDLSENAAYTMASEDAETTRVRIEEVKKIIRDLEKPSFAKASASADSKSATSDWRSEGKKE